MLDQDVLRDIASNGYAHLDQDGVLPPPTKPMEVARSFTLARHTHESGLAVLRHWRGGWWRWQGSHWVEIEHLAARAEVYAFTEHADYLKKDAKGNEIEEPWAPNRHKIADLLEALAAIVHLPEAVVQPAWIDGGHDGVIVACANGLLDVGSRELLDHTPGFFNQTAVPFDFDARAQAPERWLAFLNELWGDDNESIAALQEWFG